MSRAWLTEAWRGVAVVLTAVLVGAAFDQALAALAVALAGYLAWHLHQLYRIERWLSDGRRFEPPRADGIWAEVFHHYYRLQRRSRERKRRLAAMVREFRESTAAMPDGAVVLGTHWEILWFNKAASRLLGLRTPQDMGQRVANLVRDPAFVAYLEHGDFRQPVGLPSPKDPGRRLSLHLVRYGSDQHLLLARDVTRLFRLDQMRREFVANASHELRSPLTVISGYLETLLDDPETAQAFGAPLTTMRSQADRMRAIVDDLLELSRLEGEAGAAPFEPVDVGALLVRVRDDALALRKPGQHIVLAPGPSLPLLGVEAEIYSAVANLVANALAYSPEGGVVTIRYDEEEEGAYLSVHDDGIGIAPEHIPRLTERFYRVDAGRARDAGGTGLGLAIVRHALQRHDARLEVESEVGRGSTFTARFPPERVGAL